MGRKGLDTSGVCTFVNVEFDTPIHVYMVGHKKYLGFLFLYSAYNNAILHVFVGLLKNSVATDLERSKVKPGDNTVALDEVLSSDNKQYQSGNDCDIGVEVIPLESRTKSE